MARSKVSKPQNTGSRRSDPFRLRKDTARNGSSQVHVFGKGFVCDTEERGHATPNNRSPLELVVDASEGFIPLWATDVTLRWHFRESSFKVFQNPASAKAAVRKLFGDALLAWGDAVPVKFAERDDAWDFEIVMQRQDKCNALGCVLARGFFPDPGRHTLTIWPKMFTQEPQEQMETLCHELGHVFGLRHFFAQLKEADAPSELFGKQNAFTIMNYGKESTLTADDKADLKKLYQQVWSGQLTKINGTPIKLMKPFHTLGGLSDGLLALGELQPAAATQPQRRAAYVVSA